MADTKLIVQSGRRSPRLEFLPQEVHDIIFEHLSSKHLLWPLLLVSKKMYHAVLPTLYRKLSFIVDSSLGSYTANYKLLQLADKENQGLLFIEEVVLCPKDELKRRPRETADYPDVMQLLAAIPRNSLRRFEWDSWHQVPAKVLLLLWNRQRRLTNLELVSSSISLDEITHEIGLDGASFRQHITDLRIADVRHGKMPAVALQILREPNRIDALTLEFWAIERKVEAFEDADNDHDTVKAAKARLRSAFETGLLKGLFGTPKQPTLAQCLLLKTLKLHGVNLWHGPSYIFHAIDLKVLKMLQIIDCWSTDVFLLKMSQLPETRRPRLHHLDVYHEEHDDEPNWVSDNDHTDRTVNSIKEVLLSMEDTLDTLWIILRGIKGRKRPLVPIAQGVANHGATLRRLTIDVRNYIPAPQSRDSMQTVDWFPREEWEQVCASMTMLEQLYVAFPLIVADGLFSARPEFQDYLVRILLDRYSAPGLWHPTRR
ncbi:MAG: hypothetical protein Q9186_005334 [Xanthomendoza sp. 1 TL-2023]